MKKIILVALFFILGGTYAWSLTSGFAPCNEENGVVRCYTEKYVPYWDSLCPNNIITPPVPPVPVKPSKSNAFNSCKGCHNKPDAKFQFSNWKSSNHDKHKQLSCNKCHKI